jgi:hypothetical protein
MFFTFSHLPMYMSKIWFIVSICVVALSVFFSFSSADYQVQLDLTNKKVYLISGTTKVSVENVNLYFS